ncbi:MAG: elongation factor P maturation arginine rhamnosyltransferase EarP [Candidatus Delongbacteria bacterium]|nr:elongation factor P maturation arginine rhamnosyltransferase EarP [Candidatus Delongbacteria bacterium]
MKIKAIDIFCDVIDNYGDAGVTYRLAKSLIEKNSGFKIRLFSNNLNIFSKLDNKIILFSECHIPGRIEFIPYKTLTKEFLQKYPPAPLIIEAFACQIPEIYYQTVLKTESIIINLDHLSAENWIEGYHLKESLISDSMIKKYFFMPGFTVKSGGLILDRLLNTGEMKSLRKYYCNHFRIEGDGLIGSIFTYEHNYGNFINDIISYGGKTELVVFGEKSKSSFLTTVEEMNFIKITENIYQLENLKVVFSDFLPQKKYDELLKVTDFNFVRGEDSWARACLSGKPFIWHSYFQENNYQLVKVQACNELLKNYYPEEELFLKFSEYQLLFNNRTAGNNDNSFMFFLENLTVISAYNSELSKYLFKNCNLIKNLLFFVGSL